MNLFGCPKLNMSVCFFTYVFLGISESQQIRFLNGRGET
jgi:hypothetical protein